MKNNNPFEQWKEQKIATKELALHLKNGTLTLFLGAGISKGYGLPGWLEFVNALRKRAGLNELGAKASTDDLQNAADEVADVWGDKEKLIDEVRNVLYPSTKKLDISLAYSNPLLISLSSLLMGSKRGHVRQVITLNYDSMLEWYLSLFGFLVKSISKLPCLEGSEDVRIYHPHGFVPHSSLGIKSSDFLIFGRNDADLRVGALGDPWFEKIRQILESTICLFIGLSANTLNDSAVSPLFASVGKKIENIRPVGVWILKDNLSEPIENKFFRNNIIPIEITELKEISEFVLGISQEAVQMTTENI